MFLPYGMRNLLRLDGEFEGLHLFMDGCLWPLGGEPARFLTTCFLPMGELDTCYGPKRPSRRMIEAIYLGVLTLREQSFLRLLMTSSHLQIHPPWLVRCPVNYISAKTLFKEMLEPMQTLLLGKAFD